MNQPKNAVARALDDFDLGGEVTGLELLEMGHINDTYICDVQRPEGSRKYALQRVNTHVFTDPQGLMENIFGVTDYLRGVIAENGGDPERETLTFLRTKGGALFHSAQDGDAWRVYRYIDNVVCYQRATPELFRASARAYGRFAMLLGDYPAETLHETIHKFHDTRERYRQLVAAVAADPLGRAAGCQKEIDFAMARKDDCAVLMDMLDAGELPLRVTHNDTKLNNVLMDPETREGVCVIDLDTVMPGLSVHDFGDSIRFGASTGAEDEQDLSLVSFSLPLFETYAEGYLSVAGPAMTETEKQMLPWGARLMTLECGMRFLADHLTGDAYFHIHRQGHNLDRCRTQFKLVADMESCWDDMHAVVAKYR